MSFPDNYSPSQLSYGSTFEDEGSNSSPIGLNLLLDSPKPIRVQRQPSASVDVDFYTDIRDEWRPTTCDDLAIAVCPGVLTEEAVDFFDIEKSILGSSPEFLSYREQPSMPRAASPVSDLGLSGDDEEDCSAEITGEGAERPTFSPVFPSCTVDVPTASSPPTSFGAPSPPLSSEAPPPCSSRDLDSFTDTGSESWDRGSPESVADYDVHGDEDAYQDEDAEGEDAEQDAPCFEDESPAHEDKILSDPEERASKPQLHLIAPLPPRCKDNDDQEHDAQSEDDERDDDYHEPAPKRRRTESGKCKARVARTKRNAKSKSEGKGKARGAPKQSKKVAEKAFRCTVHGCGYTLTSQSGISRHIDSIHRPDAK
ncbi:hypothetical protein B0H11DRAFT_2034905 [Mycena galericulata]|nr:hypothetical protein B0H11DRAFT_2034905 [Mycena galericulata]